MEAKIKDPTNVPKPLMKGRTYLTEIASQFFRGKDHHSAQTGTASKEDSALPAEDPAAPMDGGIAAVPSGR